MRLHHLTTKSARDLIIASGTIKPTWHDPSDTWPWPPVVWLTAEPDPNCQGWGPGQFDLSDDAAHEQTLEVRFTVEVPDHEARAWSACKGELPYNTVGGLEASARFRGGDPADWYIVQRPILRPEWVEVVNIV